MSGGGAAPAARSGPGWGRRDWVCLPRQAERAARLFPDAHLHWFDACGHFPHWDSPTETTRLILDRTGGVFPSSNGRVAATEPASAA